MPLVTSWASRGSAILDDRSVEQRTYRVGQEDDFIDYKEVVEKNVNRWVGFTEAAASAHIDTNEQPADVTTANSWAMNEDQRVVGSYTITKTQEKKTTSVIGTTPPPVIGSVSFSVASNNNLASNFPLSLTMSTSTTGAVIRYRIDSYRGSQLVTGSWQVSTGTSQTISLNTTNTAAGASIGAVAYHKYIIIEAYAYRVLQTGTYEGPRSSRFYGYRAPVVASPTLSPAGSTSSTISPSNATVTSWPITITASGSGAGANYFWTIRKWTSGSVNGFVETTQTSGSVTITSPVVTSWFVGLGFASLKVSAVFVTGFVDLDNERYFSGQVFRQYTSLGSV